MQENGTAQDDGSTPRRTLSKKTIAAFGGLAVVAAVGMGGLAVANAQDDNGSGTTTGQHSDGGRGGKGGGGDMMGGGGHRTGDRGHGMGDRSDQMASELATALGKDTAEVEQALRDVRDELRTEGENDGTRPDRETRQAEMAAALAEKLDVSQEEVAAALDSVHAERDQERRAELSDRLDAAVEDGTLTRADADAILKGADAGVLGGRGGSGR